VEEKRKTTAKKHTRTASNAYQVTKAMYARANEAKAQGGLVAWCMLGVSTEILEAFDIEPVYTENYAAVCAAKQTAGPLIEAAEAEGYSNLVCGYVRTGIGYCLRMQPDGRPPVGYEETSMAKPDLLLACSMVCDPRYKWYQSLQRYLDIPYFFYDVVAPPLDADREDPAVEENYVNYSLEGLRDMVAFLEKHTGKKLDRERLRKIIETTEATRRKRWECYEARKAVPCPMPTGDMLSCLTPGLFLASRPEATKFFEDLYDELQERIRDKVGVVPNEKYRLLWGGGLPPWHNMGIFTYFEEKDAVFVIETAYMPFEPYDVKVKSDDPLELMVRTAYARNTERNRRAMLGCGDVATQNLLDLIRDYKVDGMVMHGSKSCRATTIGQTYYQNMVAEHVKIPTLFIESDIVDTRDYAEADMKMKIDAFIETLAAAKRNNGN